MMVYYITVVIWHKMDHKKNKMIWGWPFCFDGGEVVLLNKNKQKILLKMFYKKIKMM